MDKTIRIARAAGIIDGEGSIYTVTNRPAPCVTAEMTDKDVIDELHDLFGGTVCMPTKRQEHWKQSWRWTIQGEAAVNCIEAILPYLFSRRTDKAKEVLSNWRQYEFKVAFTKENLANAVVAFNAGEGSLRQVAVHYGVNHETLRKHAKRAPIG